MAVASPQPTSLFRIVRALQERVRRLEITSRAHTETKTFLVSQEDISAGLFIPWVFIAVNVDDRSQEWKNLIGLVGHARVGSVTVDWELDGDIIYTGHEIDDTGMTDVEIDPPIQLAPGWHELRPIVTDGTCTDLSAGYATATGRR